jgi:hypothetical protein
MSLSGRNPAQHPRETKNILKIRKRATASNLLILTSFSWPKTNLEAMLRAVLKSAPLVANRAVTPAARRAASSSANPDSFASKWMPGEVKALRERFIACGSSL